MFPFNCIEIENDSTKLRQTAAELRGLIQTTQRSAVTETLEAMAAYYDAIADHDVADQGRLVLHCLQQVLDEYACMGRLLTEARRYLTAKEFGQFLRDQAIDFRLATHVMKLFEGQMARQ